MNWIFLALLLMMAYNIEGYPCNGYPPFCGYLYYTTKPVTTPAPPPSKPPVDRPSQPICPGTGCYYFPSCEDCPEPQPCDLCCQGYMDYCPPPRRSRPKERHQFDMDPMVLWTLLSLMLQKPNHQPQQTQYYHHQPQQKLNSDILPFLTLLKSLASSQQDQKQDLSNEKAQIELRTFLHRLRSTKPTPGGPMNDISHIKLGHVSEFTHLVPILKQLGSRGDFLKRIFN